MTPEAQKLRDQMERAKADYMVLKRQRQKYQQEADRLFDLQKAADEESAKRQDALDEYGLSAAIKKARKEALKRANAKFRAAYKEFSRAIHRRDKADEQMQWAADDLLEARMRLEDLGYKVNPMAAKKAKKKPSKKRGVSVQLLASKAQMAARAWAASGKKGKPTASFSKVYFDKTAGVPFADFHKRVVELAPQYADLKPKKRNGKTIVKAKRVTIVQMPKKVNPVSPSAILRQVPAEKREAVKAAIEQAKTGRLAGLKAADGILEGVGYAHNSKISRLVWAIGNQASLKQSRTVNPRKRNVTSASDLVHVGEAKAATRDGVKGWMVARKFFPRSATPKTARLTSGAMLDLKYGDVWKLKRKGNPKKKATARKRNIAGFMQDGVFHPIRSGIEQRTTKSGTRRVKSKKAYKPSKVGEKFTYSPKKSAKRASQTKRMKAATAQRKATTTRLASRSLQRSVPLKGKRRNPSVEQKLQEWRGYPKDKDSILYAPDNAPSPLYQLGPLQAMKVEGYSARDFRIEKPGAIWVCADTKGKIHLATKGKVPMTSLPAGPIGKVISLDYGPVHKTQFYDGPEEFTHDFGEEDGKRPTLYSDGKGGLLLKGGNYRITYRGIVN